MALEAARETLLEVATMEVASPMEDWALAELCTVHALQDDWEQAHDYARQARDARTDEALLPMTFAPWYGTEALLRGGNGFLARREVEWLGRGAANNRRYRLPWHRSRAVLARWDGDLDEEVAQLQAALARRSRAPCFQLLVQRGCRLAHLPRADSAATQLLGDRLHSSRPDPLDTHPALTLARSQVDPFAGKVLTLTRHLLTICWRWRGMLGFVELTVATFVVKEME